MKKIPCTQCARERWVRTLPQPDSDKPKNPVCVKCKKNKNRTPKTTFFVRTKPRKPWFKKGRKRQKSAH